jgi:molybdopterin/thiamine biosynthesis adenylyltransferase
MSESSVGPGAPSSGAILKERILAAAEPLGERLTLSLPRELALAAEIGVSRLDVQIAAVEAEVLPLRYLRSFGTLGWAGQLKLLCARVLVVGAGGLGGFVVEGLARMGVGRIDVVDGDEFQEHNLNRQLYSSEAALGRPKAEVAAERAQAANGAVRVVAPTAFSMNRTPIR